jgi:N-acyl-L-homoserine lactone synthetase
MSKSMPYGPRQSAVLPAFTDKTQRSSPIAIRIVNDVKERASIYALRYRAYEKLLNAPPCDEGEEFHDALDNAATTVPFGAYDAGRLVGAMRLCFSRPKDSLSTLPCAGYYPELKAVKQSARESLMEVSRFTIDTCIANTSYRTTLYANLVRTSLMAAEAARVSTILVATRPGWVRFYKYMLGFDMIGQPANYPPGDLKIVLLGGSLDLARKRQRMQNAFVRISPDEITGMRQALAPILARA